MFENDFGTRTSYASNLAFSWSLGDTLGIYPIGADQVSFPISSGDGSKSANFDGGAWALRSSYQYAGYFPFSAKNYHNSIDAIPFSFEGQTQNGNNGMTHLGKYDYMASAATAPTASGSVSLQMKRLGCFMRLSLTVPTPSTLTSVTVESAGVKFGTEGTIDLSAATPQLNVTKTSSSITMALTNVTTTTANENVLLWMLTAPADMSAETLTVSVTASDGKVYVSEVAGKKMVANGGYGYSVTLPDLDFGEETGVINGHAYVDLGLSSGTLWATCNVGAETPDKFGEYYRWGETRTNEESGNNYMYQEEDLISDITGTSYDVAHQKWGGIWRMPSLADCEELIKECTWTRVTKNGVEGMKVEGTNGNWIFLPAAGMYANQEFIPEGYGCYWTGTRCEGYNVGYANELQFRHNPTYDYTGRNYAMVYNARFFGKSIRPVAKRELHYGHEYVDLGLPSGTKWATCNVGATNPEDYGDYFAWGEIEPYYTEGHAQDNPCSNWKTGKTGYNYSSYKWCNGDQYTLTKYCSNSNFGTVDNKTVLDLEDDAAHVNWGGNWRMPTYEEVIELQDNCTWTWKAENGVYGLEITGTNGNWIFLPYAGYRNNTNLTLRLLNTDTGTYWSSTLSSSGHRYAQYFTVTDRIDYYDDSRGTLSYSTSDRNNGYSVRPVTK